MTDFPKETDVAIVGAGAAGSYFAAELAAAGRKVDVFDAGPAWSVDDLISSQIWARRIKWGGAPVERGGDHPLGHNMNMGWGFGGAALHHYASWPRLHPDDFQTASRFGKGVDWPISYEDLQPHYDAVQSDVGVSGDAEAEEHRPPGAAYPMPPLQAFSGGRLLSKGFEDLGMKVYPAPMAVTSTVYGDRPPCVYDGWCDAGCPVGALANPLVTHLPKARKSGARFHSAADVRQLNRAKDGRIRSLTLVNGSGEERTIFANAFVLAAGAVHNVRLLFETAGAGGRALGDANGLLGRRFGSHLIANVYALLDEETEPHLGLSAGSLMTQARHDETSDAAYGAVTWGIGPAIKPNDLLGIAVARSDLFGPELDKFMKKAVRHIAAANGICEAVFSDQSRLEPSGSRDARGRPIIRIVHQASPETLSLWAEANRKGLAAARLVGAEEPWITPQPTVSHALGGSVMGASPETSVTDPYGRLHEAPNVVVAGSGLFCSSGAVSPTFTILALARRTAREMIARPEEFA
ncbi:MAG: GMC family oxidoreductase [Pseudomonadota bacterium]